MGGHSLRPRLVFIYFPRYPLLLPLTPRGLPLLVDDFFAARPMGVLATTSTVGHHNGGAGDGHGGDGFILVQEGNRYHCT